ncbi:MAG TPA: hypothetical protein VFW39_11225 [Sphingomicrobium sp.]|nr:hypothetical protein [Sphingomicrobium sp.]
MLPRERQEKLREQDAQVTAAQRRRWGRRAVTIHRKACELFNEIEAALGDEHFMTGQAGIVMCEASVMAKWER